MDLTLEERFCRMRQACTESGTPDRATRVDRIDRLRGLVASSSDDLADALCQDYGTRSTVQTLAGEGLAVCSQLRHTRRRIGWWMRSQRRWAGAPFAMLGGRAHLEWQPLGVVGIVSPWNFPVALTVAPLGQALAAGNRAACKVSEMTPATAVVIERAVAEWFDPTEVFVVTGGPEVSAQFTSLPFDHLFFTGSGAVGRQVMRAAADNLTPVTLELGGKSPAVVGADADMDEVARTIMFGKTFNAGQYCVAPDRLFLPATQVDAFVEACHAVARRKDPRVEATAVLNDLHHTRLRRLREDALHHGATEIVFGEIGSDADETRLLPPIALCGITGPMAISHEEIFGPLFTIHPYTRFDEVIDEINSGPQPLAAYYFGDRTDELDRFVAGTASGGVLVNDIILHVGLEHLPFGGVGHSGTGAYHGRAGFETFSHAKPVVRLRRPLTPLLAPPYPSSLERLLRAVLRAEARMLVRRTTASHRRRGPAGKRGVAALRPQTTVRAPSFRRDEGRSRWGGGPT